MNTRNNKRAANATKSTKSVKVKARKRAVKDKVILEIQEDFATPIYRENNGKLEGPLKRTFRKDSIVQAVKIGETKGNLHVRLKGNYVAFNVPTSSVFIFR